ncbi:phage tail tube protein [uncultured Secundilactobacillus sp.]|uniref:phage tail tube protein n=1 Tax=uncultured Secundilactobacillus sp. TaxID=2813935 RepID=UPI00258A1319|nr:phage tail tube protein [uncultured Secundilactobacillus sp.]
MTVEEKTTLGEYLSGRDTISTKDAKLYLTIDGNIIPMVNATEITAKWEKNKEDVQTLGSRVKHKKTTSMEGTGTLGGYVNESNWLKYALPYLEGGKDLYFEITLTIHDSTTPWGTQTVHLGEVNLDDVPIADFESDDGVMEWESDFTFETSDLVTPFTNTGM